jgi:O-antigen/teichoic acid export membrane protein
LVVSRIGHRPPTAVVSPADARRGDAVEQGSARVLASLSGYFVLVGGSGLSRVLAFATAVALARELGPARFGEMAVFLSAVTFWSSGDFIDSTYVRYVAVVRDEPGAQRYLRAACVLKLAWNAVLLVAAIPLAWTLSHLALRKPALLPAIAVAIVCGIGLNFLSLRAAIFQAQGRFVPFTAASAAYNLLCFAFVVVISVAVSSAAVGWFYGAYLLAAAIMGTYAGVALLRAMGGLRVERDTVRGLAHFSRWLFGANLGSLVTERLDVFILAAFASLATVGQYGAALRVVAIASLLTGTLAPALLPKAARVRDCPASLPSYLRHGAFLSAMIVLAITGLWALAPTVVVTMFGPAYGGAAPLVRIILVGTLCIAVYTPLSQLFLLEAQPRRTLYLALLRLSLTSTFGLLFVYEFRATGAALSSALIEGVALAYVAVSLRPQLAAMRRRARRNTDASWASTPDPEAL